MPKFSDVGEKEAFPPRPRGALGPCPWCGHLPQVEPWHGGALTKHMVHCKYEDCAVEPSVTGETRELAIAAWNRRSEPTPEAWREWEVVDPAIYGATRMADLDPDRILLLVRREEVIGAGLMWESIQILNAHFDEDSDGDLGDAPYYAWESIRSLITMCKECRNECTVCGEQIGPGHQHGEGHDD